MGEIRRPSPIHLLAGGPASRLGRDPVLTRVLQAAAVSHPAIAYIGAASGDDRPFFEMLAAYLERCGAGRVELAPTAGRRVRLERTRTILESADMILVSGGDVEEGMAILGERGVIPLLGELYGGGTPYFGISAGSIMLARQWIRWEDDNDDSTASLFPCLGFAAVDCDTHGEREGWTELRALLALSAEGAIGYGIPTGAALRVDADGAVEALGAPVHCYRRRGGNVVRGEDVPLATT